MAIGKQGRGTGHLGAVLGTVTGNPNVIGGVTIGDAGSGIYSGYTLSWGDEFYSLNIVGPQAPKARWFPTKNYGPGIRGNQTSSGTAQETDPLWTGYNDVGRGVSAGINNMYASASKLHLVARSATPAEQAYFTPTNGSINGGVRPQVSAMLHTAGAVSWYPSTNAVIVEWRAAFSGSNPAGFHPSLWLFSTLLRGPDGTEIDFEGSATGIYTEVIDHTGGVVTTQNSNGPSSYMDGVMRTYTLVIQNSSGTGDPTTGTGPVKYYVDGVLTRTYTHDGNAHNILQAALLTSHILNATYNGDTYNQAAWDAKPSGAEMVVDWMRVWRTTGVTHWKPLVTVSDLNVAYQGTGSVVLPSAATLWGDGAVLEDVQVVPYDAAEPGMGVQSNYTTALPTGVTYTSGTRTLAVDFSAGTGNAGRLHVVVYGYKADGSTCEPLRFAINRGPNFTATSIEPIPNGTGGLTADLYYTADVGLIFPKSFTATGLPTGWTLNQTTGILSAADTSVTGGTVSVTVTNGAGQQATANLELWSPAMINSAFTWDTTNATAMPNDGSSKIQFLYDIYDNTKRLAQTTSANRPLLSTSGGGDGTRRVMSTVSNGPAIRSDDAAATNVTALVAAANTANATTGTLYAVFAAKESATSTVNRILGWFKNDGTQSVSARYTTTGRGATITAAGGSQQVADQATQDTSMHVFELIKSGNSLTFTVDGAAGGSVTVTQTGGITADMFILFGTQAGGAMTGQIGPGFFSTTIPNTADKVRARKWVGNKMGVTVV